MGADLVTIFLSWLLLSSLSLLSLPWLATVSKKFLPDAGWAWGRVVGWLLVAVPVWFLAHLKIPVNTTAGIWLIFLLLLLASGWWFHRQQRTLLKIWQEAKNFIITEELLFAAGFLFLSLVRGFQPDINGLEKFMDAGLIVSYLKSPTLPIADMWLSGFSFNYYTFGHFLGAVASQIMSQPIELSYNLLLGFLMGLTLIQSFGIASLLLKNLRHPKLIILGGVVAALLVTFGGNTHHLWYFFNHGNFQGYWYPDATRFIYHTIHEFPAYSFIVSDLHAHVWSMVLVLLLIPMIFLWAENILLSKRLKTFKDLQPALYWAAAVGGLLGLIASTSTWDTMIYALFLSLAGLVILIKTKAQALKALLFSAGAVVVAAASSAAPWLLTFTSISQGVRLVTQSSPFWQLLVLWGGMLVASTSALIIAGKKITTSKKHTYWQIIVMVLLAWFLLLLPEVIYFKDIYPDHPRANTMFKFTFQAFILMQLITAWLLAWILDQRPAKNANYARFKLSQAFLSSTLILYIAAVLIYPYFGYRDYYGLKTYRGLDGLSWLQLESPDDLAAIDWLRLNVKGRPIILEAVGESYTTFARVSTFSGLPTVLGWRVHEWLWRGSFDIPGQRTGEVENIYTQPNSYAAQQKIAQYQVEYIFVGSKEREAYPNLDIAGLKKLGSVVFEQNRTFIVKLSQTAKTDSNLIEFQ